MDELITILLADDHTLVRKALRERLEVEPDLTVVADVDNADEAVAEAINLKPDIALLDIDMPGLFSFEAAQTIKDRCPKTRVAFLSAFFHNHYIDQAIQVQASGYISKGEPPESVVRAIRVMASGSTYYSEEVRSRIVVDDRGARLAQERQSDISTLTRRELEVLRYLARGMSKKEIASTMHLSLSTVDSHCSRLMKKLDIHDRVELARFAIREGLADA